MDFFKKVYAMCRKIPSGKVATYGQIAFLIGSPRAARQIGWALHCCPISEKVPCHRIINRYGKLYKNYMFENSDIQKQLLIEEGIQVDDNNSVDLKKYQWNP